MPACPRCDRSDKVYYWPDYLAPGPDYRADYASGPVLRAAAILHDLAATLAAPGPACRYYGRPGATTAAATAVARAARAPPPATDYIGPRTKCCFFRPTGSDRDHICDYKHLEGVRMRTLAYDMENIGATSTEPYSTPNKTPIDLCSTNFIVWLTDVSETPEHRNAKRQLRHVIINMETFACPVECERRIRQNEKHAIILIVIHDMAQQIVPQIHDLANILYIYVDCSGVGHNESHKEWAQGFAKVMATTYLLDELVAKIRFDYRNYTKTCMPLTANIFDMETGTDECTCIDLNGKFLHTMLFLDQLINCDLQKSSAKASMEQFLTFCMKEYEGVDTTQQIIQEFSKTYSSEQAVWWYTRDSFLYMSLNKAFRVDNMDFILAMRFFIQDLNAQLRELQKEQPIKPIRVYRSQLMSSHEVAMLYKSIGSLILISSFLSTSLSRQYALFILGDSHINDGVEQVLFEIDADPRVDGAKYFADVTEKSYFPIENEILFTLGSIFRIINVRQDMDKIHIIQMTLCSYNDNSTRPLFDYMKNETKNDTSMFALGSTLLRSGYLDEAQRIFLQTLMDTENLRDDYSISTCFYGIGTTSAMKNDFRSSVDFLNKALQLNSQLFSKNDPRIAWIHISLGQSLCALRKSTEALESYTEALNILRIAYNSEEHKEFAQCYSGMANLCRNEAKYDKALELYRKAHCIYEKLLPSDHPTLAESYRSMGRIHQELGHYDQALVNIECALSIQIKSLPPEHFNIAITYSNMGFALYGLQQNQKALECFEKANSIIHKRNSSAPETVPTSEKNIEGAKHRLRVEAMQAEARSKNGNNMAVSSPFQSPLICGGRACSKCGGCCDWNDPSGHYIKRPDAHCRHIFCYNPKTDDRPIHFVSIGTHDNPFPGANCLCNCKERDWF